MLLIDTLHCVTSLTQAGMERDRILWHHSQLQLMRRWN